MATATQSVATLVDEAKLRLSQLSSSAVKLLTDNDYNDALLRYASSSSSWVLQERAAGQWSYSEYGGPIYLLLGSSPITSTLADDTAFRINAVGPTIRQTSGTTNTSDTLTLTGSLVDFDAYMIHLLQLLRSRFASQRGVSVGTVGIEVDNSFRNLEKMIQDYTGAVALG